MLPIDTNFEDHPAKWSGGWSAAGRWGVRDHATLLWACPSRLCLATALSWAFCFRGSLSDSRLIRSSDLDASTATSLERFFLRSAPAEDCQ